MSLEKLGIPTVTLLTEPFEGYARLRARALGIPDLNVVVIPHPLSDLPRELVLERAGDHWQAVADALTG